MGLLTREEIQEVEDLQQEEVPVPEWGGSVIVQGLSAKERDIFEQSIVLLDESGKDYRTDMQNLRAKLVARTVVDEDGNRLFSEDDIAWLGEKNGAAIDRIFAVAQRLSGLAEADVEDLVKNFAAGRSDDSPTD